MQREREREKTLQRAKEAGRLLLTMAPTLSRGKDKAGLVLLKETKLFPYIHGFSSFSIKRMENFSLYNKDWSSFFIQNE